MSRRLWIVVPVLAAVGAWSSTVGEIASARDFHAYREAAQILPHGAIYGTGYIYPPTFAWLFRPFAELPLLGAARLWYMMNVAAVTASLYLVCRLAGLRGAWVWLPLLFSFRFINNTFRAGQTNVWLLFIVVLSTWLLSRQAAPGGPARGARGRTARREWIAGGLLALATVMKVWPALFLVTHALRRRWRVAGAGAAVGVVLLALPATTLGPSTAARHLSRWGGSVLAPYLRPSEPTPFEVESTGYIPGQSLRAGVHRLLRPIDATAHDERVVRLNVLDLSRGTAEGIVLVLTAALFALYLRTFLRRGAPDDPGNRPDPADGDGHDRRLVLEVGLTVLFIFLLSPYVRKGHAALLMIPFAALVAIARDPATPARTRRWVWGAVGVAVLVGGVSARLFLRRDAAPIVDGLTPLLWANVALLVGGLVAWRVGPGDHAGGSGSSLPDASRSGGSTRNGGRASSS